MHLSWHNALTFEVTQLPFSTASASPLVPCRPLPPFTAHVYADNNHGIYPPWQESTEEGVHSRWRTASGLTGDTSSSREISDENLPGLVKSPLLEYRSDWRIGSSLKFMRQSTFASAFVLLLVPFMSGWAWRDELEPPLVFAQRLGCSLFCFATALLSVLPDSFTWARAIRRNVDTSFAFVTFVQNCFMFLLEVLDTGKMDMATDSGLNAYLGMLALNAVCQFPINAYASILIGGLTQGAWLIEYFTGDAGTLGLDGGAHINSLGGPMTTAGQIMRQRDLRLAMFSSFLWLATVTCIWTTYCSETRSADEAKLTQAVSEAHNAAAKAIRAEAASKATSNLISIISHVSAYICCSDDSECRIFENSWL